MLLKIRTITKQKGQGIVEYALLLAFVVSIAMMLNGANLGGAVKDTFDKVAAVLNGEVLSGENKDYAWAKEKLSGLSKNAIREQATVEERNKMDQEALANIGRAFIGLTQAQVDLILKDAKNIDPLQEGKGVWLTNYHDPNANESETFTTDFNYNNNNSQFEANYSDITPFLNGTAIDLDNGLTNGAQGKVESSSRYFFSDYMMGENADQTDRSIRLNLHYETQTINGQAVQVVDGARVRINVGSTTSSNTGLKSYSADHDVIVNKDKKYEKTFKNDTGLISIGTSNTKNTGSNAWYNDLSF